MTCLLTENIFASADPESGTVDCARIVFSFSLLSPAFIQMSFLLFLLLIHGTDLISANESVSGKISL
jgi:hypothetical protein